MNVTVRFFSVSKDLAGTREKALTLPESADLRTGLESLFAELPILKDLHPSTMYAVGIDYASGDTLLHDGDTISVIPPVQGG